MADLDAFVTIASNNGDTFNISSNNDMLIFTDSLQQNILLGTDKTYFPHILLSSSTVEVYKNMNITGDLNVTGTLTQGGSTLGSKWSSLWRTIYLMDSNVSIGTTKSNSLLNIHDSNTTTPSNARITFSTDFTTEDGYASVGLSNNGDLIVWHTSNYNIQLGTSNELRMIISSNGAVGISNSSPAYTLDVGGDINITGGLYQNGQLFSSGQWSNDNSTVFLEQSNVAIGRTDANTLLHLHNPIADNALITFTNSVTQSNAGVICGLDSNGDGMLWHQNNFDIRMGTANSEYMRITSTGKVGVNTAFPQYQLDVYGATGAIEANVSSNLNTSNLYVEGILSSSNVANFTSNVYLKGLSFMEGDVEMSNNLMVINAFTSCNSILAEGTLDVKGLAGFSNNTTFYQPTTMYSNLNFVNAGSTYIASKTGNIGIKTEDPLYTLEVNGSISAVGYCNLLVDSYNDSSTNRAPTANALNQLYSLLGTGAADGIYASNEVVPTSNHAFNIWTGYTSTSVYTIKSNVGIGTATPATNLEIKDTTDTNVFIQMTNITNSGKIGMSNDLLIINHNNLKSITFGNSGTEYMRLTENGYLGINTSTAAYHLDVAGDMNFTGTLYKNGTAFQTSRWVSNADGIYIQSNVGINTTPSTAYDLNVGGDVNFTGTLYQNGTPFQTSRWQSNATGVYIQSNIGIQTNPNSTYELDVGGDINFTGTLFNNGIQFQTSRWQSNADGVYVTSNVGINTVTTPTYDLDVGGDINFTGTLYQNNTPFQTSRWTSNATGVYVMSNVGINANATPTDALNIGGNTVVAGNITPFTDVLYDLGSATYRFRDLWLSSNSLHLGDAVISATTSNGVDYINLPGGLKISSNIEIANSVAIRGLKILKRDGTMANITTTSIKGLSNDNDGVVITMPGNAGTDSIRFVGNGSELMRLTGTGNLGIGTTTPTSKLDVNGTINATALQQAGASVLTTAGGTLTGSLTGTTINATTMQTGSTTRITSTGALQNVSMANGAGNSVDPNVLSSAVPLTKGGTGITSVTANKVLVANSAATALSTPTNLHWDGVNNRLGIGTTTPANVLDVNGTIKSSVSSSTAGSVIMGIEPIGGSASIEIGAGRTSSGYAYLDLVGDTTYTDFGSRLARNDNGANANTELIHRGAGSLVLKAQDTSDIVFQTANTTRMNISTGGDVQINGNLTVPSITIGSLGPLKFVYGSAPSGGSAGSVNVSFGITFSAIPYVVATGLETGSAAIVVHVQSVTTTGCTLFRNYIITANGAPPTGSGAANQGYTWFAIGPA